MISTYCLGKSRRYSVLRLTPTRNNDIEPLFVSKWSKPKDQFFQLHFFDRNADAEDLRPNIKGWNDKIAIGVLFKENVL